MASSVLAETLALYRVNSVKACLQTAGLVAGPWLLGRAALAFLRTSPIAQVFPVRLADELPGITWSVGPFFAILCLKFITVSVRTQHERSRAACPDQWLHQLVDQDTAALLPRLAIVMATGLASKSRTAAATLDVDFRMVNGSVFTVRPVRVSGRPRVVGIADGDVVLSEPQLLSELLLLQRGSIS
jgi:hypothetical protein